VLGQVYLKLQNPARAADTFSAACRVAPNNGEAQYMKALSLSMSLKDRGQDDFHVYYNLALESAKKSLDLFVAQQDEQRFQRSLALIKNLTENTDQFRPNVALQNSTETP
jgi:tetratricopeptide (TPR) repeat protein